MHGFIVGWYITPSELSQDINRALLYIHASDFMSNYLCSLNLTTLFWFKFCSFCSCHGLA